MDIYEENDDGEIMLTVAVNGMNDEEKVKKWLEEHDGDDYCDVCLYKEEGCNGVTGGPDGPIFPPCCDGVEECLKLGSILEKIRDAEKEE